MKITGELHLRRMLAVLMTLVMLMTAFTMPALALGDWQDLVLNVNWEGKTAQAYAIPGSTEQAFWVTVDASALSSGITISAWHPAHGYTFSPSADEVLYPSNAGSADVISALDIIAYEGEAHADTFRLYVSTNPVPPVNVNVSYVDRATGQALNATSVPVTPYQQGVIISPDAGMVPEGYMLEDGQSGLNVYVDFNGAQPSEIVFYCAQATLSADVTVQYVDVASGAVVNSETVTVTSSDPVVRFNPAMVPEGYTYSRQTEATVEVTASGANPSTVAFYLDQAVYSADVTVQYIDGASGDTKNIETVTVTSGDPVVRFNPAMVPEGYTYNGAMEATVEVTAGGANPSTVSFYLDAVVYSAEVTVQYVDGATGAVLNTETVTISTGEMFVYFNQAMVPEGYTYSGDSAAYVQVTASGANPSTVSFYLDAVVYSADVTVQYVDVASGDVISSETVTVRSDDPIVRFNAAMVPEGYAYSRQTEATVEVTASGANPSTVMFYLDRTSFSAQVTVQYIDGASGDTVNTETVTVTSEDPVVRFNTAMIPEGYTYNGDAETRVEVSPSGANPATVSFYLDRDVYSAVIMVEYVNRENGEVVNGDLVTVSSDDPYVRFNPAMMPEGYTCENQADVPVEITAAGTTTAMVQFTLTPPKATEAPATEPPTAEPTEAPATEVPTAEPTEVPATEVPTAEPTEVSTEVPTQVPTEAPTQAPTDVPIPVGEMIQRWGYNTVNVNVRREPTKDSRLVTTLSSSGTRIYVLREEVGQDGELWMRVLIGGEQCFIKSEFMALMTVAESDQYMRDNYNSADKTPVPPMTVDQLTGATPEPTEATEAPTEVPTEVPTAVPTEVPTAEPSAEPTVTPTPEPYLGYALTTQQVALRASISAADASIIQTLAQNTLVLVSQPGYDTDGTPWSVVTTLDDVSGFVPDSSLRRINNEEAKYYLDQWEAAHATAEPTATPTTTPVPQQLQGYAAAIGDGVPYRNMPSSLSVILGNLAKDEIVYVAGQQYVDGMAWHVAQYGGQWVYIQADLLRMLTPEEELAYLTQSQMTPEPTLAVAQPTYNPGGMSSYGYVSASSVNFRSGAGTNTSRIATLRQYAFCLVLGTEKIGNTTWYNVNYNGQKGYISGDYFKQLTISELQDFLTSPEYTQGLTNNNTQDNLAGTGTSGLPSAEDQTRNEWAGSGVTFQPFEPFATVGPVEESASPEASPSVSPSEQPTISIEPMATVDLDSTSTERSGGSALGWVIAIILLLAAAGGVYVYLRIRDSKRKMAARAAQRRAQAARGDARPYARNNGATPTQQPRTGTYPNQNAPQQARRPAGSPQQGSQQQATTRPSFPQNGANTASTGTQPTQRPSYSQLSGTATSQNMTGATTPATPARPTAPSTGFERPEGTAAPYSGYTTTPVTGFERPEGQTAPQAQPTQSAPVTSASTESKEAPKPQGENADGSATRLGRRSAYQQAHNAQNQPDQSGDAPKADEGDKA